MLTRIKPIIRVISALAMAGIGTLHFTSPDGFVNIVPEFLPAHLLLVYISGACEIAFGLGLLVPKLRLYAAIGLILLYIAVFPANVNMVVTHAQPNPLHPVPEWAAWARLPFQALFIAVAWWLRR